MHWLCLKIRVLIFTQLISLMNFKLAPLLFPSVSQFPRGGFRIEIISMCTLGLFTLYFTLNVSECKVIRPYHICLNVVRFNAFKCFGNIICFYDKGEGRQFQWLRE